MRTIKIILSKACRIGSAYPEVPHLLIEATIDVDEELGRALPDKGYARFYESQARSLVEAFKRTLPGGLIDAILLSLLEWRVSSLKVAPVQEESDV